MIDVIQIFKSVDRIEKPDYDNASRQNVGIWETIISKTGFLKHGTLNLPIEMINDQNIKNSGLIIIQDIKINNSYDLHSPQFKGFSTISKSCNFEIFEFRKTDNDTFEVWLKYSDTIGSPKRENHKIAELKIGKPVRYKINGKDDFTLTGRKQRTFYEFDFLLEYIGKADKIEYKELNKIAITKTLPVTNCKIIDERKILT